MYVCVCVGGKVHTRQDVFLVIMLLCPQGKVRCHFQFDQKHSPGHTSHAMHIQAHSGMLIKAS